MTHSAEHMRKKMRAMAEAKHHHEHSTVTGKSDHRKEHHSHMAMDHDMHEGSYEREELGKGI